MEAQLVNFATVPLSIAASKARSYWEVARAISPDDPVSYPLEMKKWRDGGTSLQEVCSGIVETMFGHDWKVDRASITEFFHLQMQSAYGAIIVGALVSIFEDGVPVVRLDRRIAASLLATNVPAEVADEVRLPFRGFLVEVPDGLLHATRDGKLSPIRRIAFARVTAIVPDHEPDPHHLVYSAYSESGSVLHGTYPRLSQMLACEDSGQLRKDPFATERTDIDELNGEMVSRLLVNLSILMTSRESYREKSPPKGSRGKRRMSSRPTTRVFVLTRTVTHDVSRPVSAYSRGEGRKVNVQCLVRGHWKSQPYGKDRLLRKHIFIEPYWRGPEDAPIALRRHDLTGGNDGTETD